MLIIVKLFIFKYLLYNSGKAIVNCLICKTAKYLVHDNCIYILHFGFWIKSVYSVLNFVISFIYFKDDFLLYFLLFLRNTISSDFKDVDSIGIEFILDIKKKFIMFVFFLCSAPFVLYIFIFFLVFWKVDWKC